MESIEAMARAERRKERRYAAHVDGMLLWDGLSQPVTIENVSIYGLRLRGTYLPPLAEWVTVIADHLEICGTVLWLGPDCCGILLSTPIDPFALIKERPIREVTGLPPMLPPGALVPIPAAMGALS